MADAEPSNSQSQPNPPAAPRPTGATQDDNNETATAILRQKKCDYYSISYGESGSSLVRALCIVGCSILITHLSFLILIPCTLLLPFSLSSKPSFRRGIDYR